MLRFRVLRLQASACVTTCPSYYYGDGTSFLCEACQESLCEGCSGDSGQTCTKCQEGVAILDNDGVCKECEEMQIEYKKSTDTGSQFYITLSPETRDLTLSYVKSNLGATKKSKENFPSFTSMSTKQKQAARISSQLLFKTRYSNPLI